MVERRTARRMDKAFGLESKAALDRDALSLIRPITSLNVILPIEYRLERERERSWVFVEEDDFYVFFCLC